MDATASQDRPVPSGRPQAQRRERRERRERRRVRRRTATTLMTAGGLALAGSLFLTWSHQVSAALLARYGGSAMLREVPHDPTAWQVYSVVDLLLLALAVALVALAPTRLSAPRSARLALAGAALVALAFVVHALAVPPTNGVNLFDPFLDPPRYVATGARSGAGEVVAVFALLLSLGGIGASLPDG